MKSNIVRSAILATAVASIAVAADPPSITKAFGLVAVPKGQPVSLTFTITNPNPATPLTSVAFSDSLPTGLLVALPNALTNSCGGVVTANPAASVVSLSGGLIPAASTCTVSVNVVSSVTGFILN